MVLFLSFNFDYFPFFLSDIGCQAGGSLECVNGGICVMNGSCICPVGYSNKTCSDCKYWELLSMLNSFMSKFTFKILAVKLDVTYLVSIMVNVIWTIHVTVKLDSREPDVKHVKWLLRVWCYVFRLLFFIWIFQIMLLVV